MQTAIKITKVADRQWIAEARRSSNGQGRMRLLGIDFRTKTEANAVAQAYCATGARPAR